MAYKTFDEQIQEHVSYLHSQNLDVSPDEFAKNIDSPKWTRCLAEESGCTIKKGSRYVYKANLTEEMTGNLNLCGIRTSCRGPNGVGDFKTYGLKRGASVNSCFSQDNEAPMGILATVNDECRQAAKRAYGFWETSSIAGRSDYLDRKGVGAHGVRFRYSEKYGHSAVVPMRDVGGRVCGYQILNPDGTKHMAKGTCTLGLFHVLGTPKNGDPIGVAEGYVTAATCLELVGIPTACSFSAENLLKTTEAILSLYPVSPVYLFSDNDRHLEARGWPNAGVIKSREAQALDPGRIKLIVPDFGNRAPSKDSSDWNDLMRLEGRDYAAALLKDLLGGSRM